MKGQSKQLFTTFAQQPGISWLFLPGRLVVKNEVLINMDAFETITAEPPTVRFTCKESKVFEMLAAGKSNPQIAESLGMSVRTVRFHVGNILKKLNAANRTEAVVNAVHKGILEF